MRLQGEVAVHTGASGGLGRAITGKLVAEAARVLAVDRSEDALQPRLAKHGETLATLAVNVMNYTQVEGMIKFAADRFGRVDTVINHAGIGSAKTLLDHDPLVAR